MISIDAFFNALSQVLSGRGLNLAQTDCVRHGLNDGLMIIAGPGSGKTTVLVLRAIRHILVDGMPPESVLITTFTRKGAGEISSRLIDWGQRLIDHFKEEALRRGDQALAERLIALDINAARTGTFDSFCQEWLAKTRTVGSPAPVMLEQFAADYVYRRRIFAAPYRNGSQALLDPYLRSFNFEQQAPRNQAQAAALSTGVNHRLLQDLVDVTAYAGAGPAQAQQAQMLADYAQHLSTQQMFDFSLCAIRILEQLRSGGLYGRLPPIRALMVDEYQDTNPIQEAIYFELVKLSGCAYAVVGDDDQALYRFRGATVELFTNFQTRYPSQVPGASSRMVYLTTNHRSTPEIVDFVNRFAAHDPSFVLARVAGKPALTPHVGSKRIPVLGMFRNSLDDLSADLSQFLLDVFGPNGRPVGRAGEILRGSTDGGAIGDAVLLASTAREYKDTNNGQVECLPAQLRRHLSAAGLGVFNPRGQDLRDLTNVQRLLGLVVHCVDPTGAIAADMPLTGDTRRYLQIWRDAATAFMATNPTPNSATRTLRKYVDDWAHKRATSGTWPAEIPLLDLLYKLIVWMPEFQRNPEHQIYLEAIMRCVTQGAHYSPYGFSVLENAPHDVRSRQAVLRDLMEPVADCVIDVDEDLLFAVPRNRLSIMTIHQSKGLEYPLVIVDVGSEFKMNHAKQAFKRYPRDASSTVVMESALAQFTQVGALRTARSDLDRTFDDLMRLYYVAYSRAQVALLLVGLTPGIEYATKVKNIATFWRRDDYWTWRKDNPPLRSATPTRPEFLSLELI